MILALASRSGNPDCNKSNRRTVRANSLEKISVEPSLQNPPLTYKRIISGVSYIHWYCNTCMHTHPPSLHCNSYTCKAFIANISLLLPLCTVGKDCRAIRAIYCHRTSNCRQELSEDTVQKSSRELVFRDSGVPQEHKENAILNRRKKPQA